MSTPFLLKIPRRFCEEMVAQALSEFPNECCGLLAGRIQLPTTPPSHQLTTLPPSAHSLPIGQVERCYPLLNAAELAGLILSYLSTQPFLACMGPSPVEFLSDPKSLFAAVRDMHLHEIDILAVYHSHPTSAAIPSRTDLERNFSPEVMNLIISLQNPQAPIMRGWWLSADQYFEAEWICVEDAGRT